MKERLKYWDIWEKACKALRKIGVKGIMAMPGEPLEKTFSMLEPDYGVSYQLNRTNTGYQVTKKYCPMPFPICEDAREAILHAVMHERFGMVWDFEVGKWVRGMKREPCYLPHGLTKLEPSRKNIEGNFQGN